MAWLVTGGAGYVGAHVVRALRAAGHPVVVFDDLSTGRADRVPDDVAFVFGAVTDRAALDRAFASHEIVGVVHLAGRKSAPDSLSQPVTYYRDNVGGLTVLLEAMGARQVERLVFSSSAAVYGLPVAPLLAEDGPTCPVNPYGQTKLVGEQLIRACGQASGLSWIALRYFNVAGTAGPALLDRGGGSLLPRVFAAMETGRPLTIHGGDHPTRDGTAVRDYVHVEDIASAHVVAVEAVTRARCASVYNVGTGAGSSVLDVVRCVFDVTGCRVPVAVGPRRPGDPPYAVADVRKIHDALDWRARHGLADAIASVWAATGDHIYFPQPTDRHAAVPQR